MVDAHLIGIGLYTPAEAAQLIKVPAAKITRWLRGHEAAGKYYAPLWEPQVDLDDGHVYLGFRDLLEARVADVFIRQNLSAQKVRRAIVIARDIIGAERPLSTTRFRTDGRTVFLQVLREDNEEHLIDLFRNQMVFRSIIEPSLKNIDFDIDGIPSRWWPRGKSAGIVIDPNRAFGQPIDHKSGVPTAILAAAAKNEKSIEIAARIWRVPASSIRRAVEFQADVYLPKAA